MTWTAIVPLKGGLQVKSRLSRRLNVEKRNRLSRRMAKHVLGRLVETAIIDRIIVLSPDSELACGHEWREDGGRGLNAELEHLCATIGKKDLLILHGDLPLLSAKDIDVLIAAASNSGIALAPDRRGAGTNAVAIGAAPSFPLQFGENSFERHRRAAGCSCAIIRRIGLAVDIDTPADLDFAVLADAAGGVDMADFRTDDSPAPQIE